MRFMKNRLMLGTALTRKPEPPANTAAATDKLGLSTVPAAWPTGVSQLEQAMERIAAPPPSAPALTPAEQAKKRD
jgi:hypothetical protein